MDGARDRSLPRGLIHGDLFRDNVLWAPSGEIAALLDFESACEGSYAYDLMVTVLSWCFGDDLDGGPRASSVRDGYARVRPLAEQEAQALGAEGVRFAALRFTRDAHITDYAMRTTSRGAARREGLAALHGSASRCSGTSAPEASRRLLGA